MQHLLEKCENIFQNPSKGLHLIRNFSHQIPFDPTHSLQTVHVTRTIPPKLLEFNEHKLASQLTYRNQVNKLTMLFVEVLNSRSNSFQLGGHDTTQLDKQMPKDTMNTSQSGQSYQHPRQGPAKLQKDLNRRRIGHRAEHQMFFLLSLKRQVYVNKLGSLWGSK